MGKFPAKLMQILESPDEVRDSLGWNSDGDGFWMVPDGFAEKVLAKYFQGEKFESFIRKISRWGFVRVKGTKSPHRAQVYRHDAFKFHRGKPELLKQMKISKEGRRWRERKIRQEESESKEGGIEDGSIDEKTDRNSKEPLSHDLPIADAVSLPKTLLDSHKPLSQGSLPKTLLDSHTPASSRFFADRALNHPQADQVQLTTVPAIRSVLPTLPSPPRMSALNDQRKVDAILRELHRLDQEEPQRVPSSTIMSSRPIADRALYDQQQVNRLDTTAYQPITDVPAIPSLLPSLLAWPSRSSHPFVDRAHLDQQQVNRLDNTAYLRELYRLDQEELQRLRSWPSMGSRPFVDRALYDQQQVNRLDNSTAFLGDLRSPGPEVPHGLSSSAMRRVFADRALNDNHRVNNNAVLWELQRLDQEEQAIRSAAEFRLRSIRRCQEEHLLALLCRER
jgi:hypothetical protein